MTVKVVVLDLDLEGTVLGADDTPAPGITEMIKALRDAGLKIVFAASEPRVAEKDAWRKPTDHVLDPHAVGSNKGAGGWIGTIQRLHGVERNEIVWLGDSISDMSSAVVDGTMYFSAAWSHLGYPHGLEVDSPLAFGVIVLECLAKSSDWYWRLDTTDRLSRPVAMRALVDGNWAGLPVLKRDVLTSLREGPIAPVGPISINEFVLYHLLGSMYDEGLLSLGSDIWGVYVGHAGASNPMISPFARIVSQLFRDRYAEALVVRHSAAPDGSVARVRGVQMDYITQLNSVHLNPAFRKGLRGSRVLMFDDFTTYGYSMECARNLLFQAGASQVTSITFGKYPHPHTIITPRDAYSWDPFKPMTHSLDCFELETYPFASDARTPTTIRESYRRIASVQPDRPDSLRHALAAKNAAGPVDVIEAVSMDKLRLIIDGDEYRLEGGQFGDMLEAVKSLPNRHFDGATRVWHIGGKPDEAAGSLTPFRVTLVVASSPLAAEAVAPGRVDRIRVCIDGDQYDLEGGDFDDMLEAVKSLPDRQFDDEDKAWNVEGAVREIAQELYPFRLMFRDDDGSPGKAKRVQVDPWG